MDLCPASSPRAASIVLHSAMMKKEISLNLDEQSSELKSGPDGLLGSPDLGLLKLTSPDLERLIIQSSGGVGGVHPSTPAHFFYPKSGSDEQEFAEGFVKALEDLHKQNQLSDAGPGGVPGGPGGPGLHPADLPVYTTLNGYAASPLGATTSPLHGATTLNYSTDTIPFPPPPPPHLSGAQAQSQAQTLAAAAALSRLQAAANAVKDEPQTVPDMQSFGESPPLSPIDMDNQERIKAERKKLRNRIAASKCRKRKLERISRLEDKVKSLKTQNTELASTASVLREQVAQLKQKVMNHVSSGCQLLPSQVQAY
ncbi:transcription factor JunD-like [Cololabis saira]|uniref:transcription factor JunD-like n=1 Tax=Cololabis saira TaxID=129043 RepID=UPI002AD3A157|nr:transcription factor JunD-like [Cololabis saira]